MLIVDAHLDLAYNALRGRDVLRPAAEQTPDVEGIPSVGLPDLLAGGVGLICATIFCEPSIGANAGYKTPQQAFDAGCAQLSWYTNQHNDRRLSLVKSPGDLGPATGAALPAILLLEGADPIRTPADVTTFFDAGVRIVGLAWKRTRYAGGTGAPGPLTPAGVELVPELDRAGIIHDLSHLAEESFWQLLDISAGPVIASHSNCRSFVPTDRQLSDEMAKAVFRRDGVIGINFFDKFLIPPDQYKARRATLTDVTRHVRHYCDLAGDAAHVGLGTDMDGGLGRDEIPEEIRTSADLPRVADALSAAGFSDRDVRGIMGENWVRYFKEHLPR
jgi:membrane dipeptidase